MLGPDGCVYIVHEGDITRNTCQPNYPMQTLFRMRGPHECHIYIEESGVMWGMVNVKHGSYVCRIIDLHM